LAPKHTCKSACTKSPVIQTHFTVSYSYPRINGGFNSYVSTIKDNSSITRDQNSFNKSQNSNYKGRVRREVKKANGAKETKGGRKCKGSKGR
jgi:hypothetical protein